MTTQKHLKQLVRSRMAKTGESYSTARRLVLLVLRRPAGGALLLPQQRRQRHHPAGEAPVRFSRRGGRVRR